MALEGAVRLSAKLIGGILACGLMLPLPATVGASLIWKLSTVDGLVESTFELDPSSAYFRPNGVIDTASGGGILGIDVSDGTGFGYIGPLFSSPIQLGPNPADPAGASTAGLLIGEDSWKQLDVFPSGNPDNPYSIFIQLDIRPPGAPPPAAGAAPPGAIEAFVARFGATSYSALARFEVVSDSPAPHDTERVPEPRSATIWLAAGMIMSLARPWRSRR